MAKNFIFATLILFGNLFIKTYSRPRNDSHNVSVEKTKRVTYSQNNNLSYLGINKVGLDNKSYNPNECDCGFGSTNCRFDTFGKRICDCLGTHSQNGDKCEWCNCGMMSRGCKFENNKMICSCDSNYAQNDRDQCEECRCGDHAKGCKFNGSQQVCNCESGYSDLQGKCARCDCGAHAIGCKFDTNQKVCSCEYGYNDRYGGCFDCDCGLNATSCELTSDKHTKCTCKTGYVAENTNGEMDENCVLQEPGLSGWKIFLLVIVSIFGIIYIISEGVASHKKMKSCRESCNEQ